MTIVVCYNCGNETGAENPFSMVEENVVFISNCKNCMIFHQGKKDMSNERAKMERPRQEKK